MRLFLMPVSPGVGSGYARIAEQDLLRYNADRNDSILVASRSTSVVRLLSLTTPNPRLYHFPRVKEYIANAKDVFVGDLVLLPTVLSHLSDGQKVTIRFHNLYSRVMFRQNAIANALSGDLRFAVLGAALSALERRVLANRHWSFEMVTCEDARFCTNILKVPEQQVSVHNFVSPIVAGKPPNWCDVVPFRLIWVGGVSAHKSTGLFEVLRSTLPKLRRLGPWELHLYGKGTEKLNEPPKGVYGFGFTDETLLPKPTSGIFINPDPLGLGIKVKVHDLITSGARFISTEEGLTGYDVSALEPMVGPIADWHQIISNHLSSKQITLNKK